MPTEDVHGYVYVEPFELRKEFAVFLRAFPKWQAAAELGETIAEADRQPLLEEFAATLTKACPLQADGADLPLKLDRIRFVRIADELGVIPDDRAEIPAGEALVAAVFAVPMEGYPEKLSLTWDFFPRPDLQVPVAFVTPAGRATLAFSTAKPSQTWNVPATAKLPGLLPVPDIVAAADTGPAELPLPSVILLGLAVLIGLAGRFASAKTNVFLGIAAVVCLAGTALLWNVGRVPLNANQEQLPAYDPSYIDEVVYALLRNIYHAFDYRDESKVYDTLAATVEGDLLEQIYLDIRRGLELEDQGGPRVKVTTVDLRKSFAEPMERRQGFRADVEWRAVGEVTHWGHTHKRPNFYHAWLAIEPRGDAWKVTEIEIIDEGRL